MNDNDDLFKETLRLDESDIWFGIGLGVRKQQNDNIFVLGKGEDVQLEKKDGFKCVFGD